MSIIKFDGLTLLLICTVLTLSNDIFIKADKLLMVHAIWRHGDRSCLASFPKDPYRNYWEKLGFGQLTNTGATQQQRLGRWLRSRYVAKYRFLSGNLDNRQIYIQSTNFSRTIQSAQHNLKGMYNTLPPIHITNNIQDQVVQPLQACRRSIQLKDMTLRTSNYKTYVTQKKSLFDRLTQLTGTTQTLQRISVLADTLRVEKLKGKKISSELNQLFPQIRAAEDKIFLLQYGYEIGNYGGQNFRVEIPRSLGGPLLKTMIDRMKAKASGQRFDRRYIAYSAHDSTIMFLLSTFGFKYYDYNRNLIPSFASVLLFEMWERSADKVPYVKVFYRRDDTHFYDLTNKISGCANGCTLDQFYTRSKPFLITNLTSFCATPPHGY